MDAFKPLIAKVATGASLTEAEARAAFELDFRGKSSLRPSSAGS